MQSVALGWLVYDLTRRASLLGTISFCGNVPFIALGLLGGAVAGTIYGAVGPATCFALNACGFMVLGVALARIRLPHRPVYAAPPMAHALREGLAYARTHPVIWPALVLATAVSVFGFPYIVL